jgi:hypothetical protein
MRARQSTPDHERTPSGVYVAASVETRQRLYPGYGFDPRGLPPMIAPLTGWPEDFRVPVYVAKPAPRVVLGPMIDRPRRGQRTPRRTVTL